MMPAVQTLLSGDVHQIYNPGKGEANETACYIIPVSHAKEKNTQPNYKTPLQDRAEHFNDLIKSYYLQGSITKAGYQLPILKCINQ